MGIYMEIEYNFSRGEIQCVGEVTTYELFGTRPPENLPFQLLAVCRQIYVETCLLPFKLKVFSCHENTIINTWSQLMPTQTHSIETVQFTAWEPGVIMAQLECLPYFGRLKRVEVKVWARLFVRSEFHQVRRGAYEAGPS
jgi:hypothetical protein